MGRELRLLFRTVAKSPGYFIAAVATLGLTIAALSAITGAVEGLLFAPTAIHEPGRLAIWWETDRDHRQALVEVSYRIPRRIRVVFLNARGATASGPLASAG
jgi:hypothetical protein